jgi:hypothetical protein
MSIKTKQGVLWITWRWYRIGKASRSSWQTAQKSQMNDKKVFVMTNRIETPLQNSINKTP